MPDRSLPHREIVDQVRAVSAALDGLTAEVSRQAGLNRTDMRALDVIGRRDGLTAGELASSLRLTTGAVTGVIDRLERAGQVVRQPDREDRRRVLVQPTADAEEAGEQLQAEIAGAVAESLDGCSAAEREAVGRFLARLGAAVAGRSGGPAPR